MSKSLEAKDKRTISSRLSVKASHYSSFKKIKLSTNSCETSSKTKAYLHSHKVEHSLARLNREFFHRPCIKLAQTLLGKVLARKTESGEVLRGRIVETECYLGVEDKASHSFKGKKTERNEAMFMEPGTAYVYSIYGMYYCFNISSLEEGSAVLIRALEPLNDTSTMFTFRSLKRKGSKSLKVKDLCNGPSKLCQAFKIEKHALNKVDLNISEDLWVEVGIDVDEDAIIACKRIGIDSAGEEWANKPLRFYIKNNPFVSIRNKQAEANIYTT